MSEYWKSTPKYWCKHCKTYVRDTKLERTQHEATGRHQGNLKRFIRDLHRDHEREEREKDSAKKEVERLNGVVSGDTTRTSTNSVSGAPWRRNASQASAPAQAQGTPGGRMKQLAQLAEMGVSIPDEFRRDMAMAGEWQTVSERVLLPHNDPAGEAKADIKSTGPLKRKYPGEEDENGEGEPIQRRDWGSTIKVYPTLNSKDSDLDALLGSRKPPGLPNPTTGEDALVSSRSDHPAEENPTSSMMSSSNADYRPSMLKTELSDIQNLELSKIPIAAEVDGPQVKESDGASEEVMFKKRKAKNIRHK